MMDISVGTSALLAGIVALCCYYIVSNLSSRRKDGGVRAPPALPSLPLIGSLPFLSGLSSLHLCLTEKSKTYGNIFSLRAGSRNFVVLNGYELIREALVKNSAEFAGRGVMYVEKYVWPDHGKGIVMRQPSDSQRKLRTNCLSVLKTLGFGSRAVMELKIQEEVDHLVSYVRSKGEQSWHPAHYLEQFTMNVIYNLMFSKRFEYDGEEGQRMARLTNGIAETVDPIYDIFPFVKYFPPFKQNLSKITKIYDEFLSFCESNVEDSLSKNDKDEINFVAEYYKLEKDFNKRDMAVVVRDLVGAGTETTSGQLSWALVLLTNHPDIQQRAHDELDSVVPRDRLPSLEDKTRLCYLEAIILEVLRLKTAVPFSIPHAALDDVIVGGYNIQAGTEVMINLWSAHMDPQVWGDPEKFRPERFLDENGQIINKELMITFSLGKRSCLGEVLARQEMFLLLGSILQQFTLLPPEGDEKVKDEAVFARTLVPEPHTLRFLERQYRVTY